jgi:hypothetical protein
LILAESAIFGALAVLFHYQALNAKRRIIVQSNIMAMSYALQPQPYKSSSARYFCEFGFPSIISIFQDPMSGSAPRNLSNANFIKLSIWLESDMKKKEQGDLEKILDSPQKYRFQETQEEVSVNVPLYNEGAKKPYGIVRVTSTIAHLQRDVFFKNFFLYLAIVLLYNSQLLLIYLYQRQRKKETVVYLEKGYLREHAIGALKLQHKILGDIIADHEGMEEAQAPGGKDQKQDESGQRLRVLERPKQDS